MDHLGSTRACGPRSTRSPGIAQRQRDGGRWFLERRVEGVVVEHGHDVVDHERTVVVKPLTRSICARSSSDRREDGADAAQPSGHQDTRGDQARGTWRARSSPQDRDIDVEQLAEARADDGAPLHLRAVQLEVEFPGRAVVTDLPLPSDRPAVVALRWPCSAARSPAARVGGPPLRASGPVLEAQSCRPGRRRVSRCAGVSAVRAVGIRADDGEAVWRFGDRDLPSAGPEPALRGIHSKTTRAPASAGGKSSNFGLVFHSPTSGTRRLIITGSTQRAPRGGCEDRPARISRGTRSPEERSRHAPRCSSPAGRCSRLVSSSTLEQRRRDAGGCALRHLMVACDEIIKPDTSVILSGATNTRTGCLGHVSMLASPSVYAGVRTSFARRGLTSSRPRVPRGGGCPQLVPRARGTTSCRPRSPCRSACRRP